MNKSFRMSSIILLLLLTNSLWGQVVSFDKVVSQVGLSSPASYNNPKGIAIDASGNIYMADRYHNRIQKISPSGIVTTLAGGGQYQDGSDGSLIMDGQGVQAVFWKPEGVDVDANGNVYVADYEHHLIRKITPSGMVSTFAGTTSSGNTDGPVASASFVYPSDVKIDEAGNLFVLDENGVRKISTSGIVTTVTRSVRSVTTNPDEEHNGFDIGPDGNLYVPQKYWHSIQKVSSAGVTSTYAGSADGSSSGYIDGPLYFSPICSTY